MPIASFDEENKLVQETSVGGESQHFLGMSGWLVRKGLASNQTSADLTLVVIAIFASAIGIFFFYRTYAGTSNSGKNIPVGTPKTMETTSLPQ